MKKYVIKNINNVNYVLTTSYSRECDGLPNANFAGTGMALCGILQDEETIEEWHKRSKKEAEIRRHNVEVFSFTGTFPLSKYKDFERFFEKYKHSFYSIKK